MSIGDRGGASRFGFTIVELIIVIAVIGILAAVTIVAYHGAKQRANAVATAANVKAYVEALEVYSIRTHHYIDADACLGDPAQFDDGCGWYEYSGGICSALFGKAPGRYTFGDNTDADTFNSALEPYIDTKLQHIQPIPTHAALFTILGCTVTMNTTAPTYSGYDTVTVKSDGELSAANVSGGSHDKAYIISYSLPGDVTCPLRGSIKTKGFNHANYTLCQLPGGDVTRS